MTNIQLFGKVIIETHIEAVTGLEIGGIDKAVIRNPIDKRPYIPGSSLRGKMRSQTEKVLGRPQNKTIGQVTIHTCQTQRDYDANGGCPVCHIFGVPAEEFNLPARLLVRDAKLSDDSAESMVRANTELRYAELKTEVAIDRVTSAASPRNLERVPAGAVFGPAELIFNIYTKEDYARLKVVIDALQLVEDDYLGGAGSRGSGKVRFKDLCVTARRSGDYGKRQPYKTFPGVQELSDDFANLQTWLASAIPAK
jgi:CRISPR-associated protein Csm3